MFVSIVVVSYRLPSCCGHWVISSQEILEMFYETTVTSSTRMAIRCDAVPSRLRGDVLDFDVQSKRTVMLEQGRRITARHIREMEKAKITRAWSSS